ncbi:unnamed protein product [Phytophthora fragariaefolia]|uniref:Unnamed protein product n=1 Tax=Phytophthora fragariaefolia TaxID=1490495 RepID=A0A9W6XK72_9STRA|nr:unnamed protein product [Phytophthora fragariaefolia]
MVHLTHSSIHWRLRCIGSSSDENTPPNVLQAAPEQDSPSSASSATGTVTPPWLSPEKTKHRSKFATNPPPSPTPETPPRSAWCACASPTTSSPVLLETPPRSPARTKTTKTRHPRQGLQERRQAAAPYARQRSTPHNVHRPAAADQDRHVRVTDAAHGRNQAAATDQDRPIRRGAADADQVHQARHPVVEPAPRAALLASQPGDVFVPARWPYTVAHLREQFNPPARPSSPRCSISDRAAAGIAVGRIAAATRSCTSTAA